MKLILDSHALIWWMDRHGQLSETAYECISEPENELLISAATVWEIGIKVGLGKLSLSLDYKAWMETSLASLEAVILPVTIQYSAVQAKLPYHHGDPFDRLIAAQAITDGIAILSRDEQFDAYGVSRIW